MLIQPRAYQDEEDLEAMRAILMAGLQAKTLTHYIHIGDLHWWLYDSNLEDDRRQIIHLWEATDEERRVVGWTLFSPAFTAFDVFVHPALLGSAAAAQIWVWSEEQMANALRAQGEQNLLSGAVAEQDRWLNAHLLGRGFVRSPFTLGYLKRTLDDDLPAPCLPPGYQVRHVRGTHEVEARSIPARAAFGSQIPLAHYCWRYLTFMRSPVYTPELDLVIEAPDGQLVAFCLCWLDAVNRVGHVEPMGVHPGFQRRGLGRALLQAGLRLMQTRGMATATVCSALSNVAANRLYERVGFLPAYQLYTYRKELR
jgi:mycothiol synthase